ncbi:secretion protein HlyD [Pelagivirga sediminicola]|uniref:Secretion protein HlyD n=1 Tax=Pelagivirga sediminicola TaxID=2170575 RepID=A0A2T7G4B9_9RHOB|nr:HlyD family efflux transporter periplasmic adaptor subunit [Pelagivirga sediminicola]PVA09247.1 secretion protein HlyD [Pelagivirga sediminicola]
MTSFSSVTLPQIADEQQARTQSRIIWLTMLFFAAALSWAWAARLDEVTTAEGQVIPIRQEQVVQSLEGGLLRELNVRSDEIVEAGEVLARLDPTGTEANVDETEAQLLARRARIARLTAEITDKALHFPKALLPQEELIATEKALYDARRDSLSKTLSLIRDSRDLLEEELDAMTRLSSLGASSRMDAVRLQRQIVELNMKETEIRHDYYVNANEELAKTKAEAEALAAELRGGKDRLERLTLRSPVRGIVKDIAVTTVGGVVAPNGELMTIVPLDEELLVEARVKPRDIAFIRPAMRATVKVTAYDYAIYGTLEGEVRSISPDSIQDEADPQKRYYRVFVRSDTFELAHKAGRKFAITPGMVATVDIHTGSKTVLQYLVKPFNRAAEALRER